MSHDADSFSLDVDSSSPWSLDPPSLKAYLASALTNIDGELRDEANRGRQIIRELLEGYDYQGIRFEVYDPGAHTPPGTDHSDEDVYRIDHERTSAADLVIFYVLAPSLGVGMEAQICAECTLPRVVIKRRDSSVSRMFTGVFSPTIASLEYHDMDDLRGQFSGQLLQIASATVRSAKERREHVALFCREAIGEKIMRLRLLKGISLAELAQRTEIREVWLRRLEREPALAPSMTLIQQHRIASILETRASLSAEGVPTFGTKESQKNLSTHQQESLKNLVEFAKRDDPSDDQRLLTLWNDYIEPEREEALEALRHRGEHPDPISADEWKRRYYAQGGQLF